ncbi:C1 family peptidase [Chondromyces crocatus]|uniref:Peptidase C1A papain C-terminal domain-containing protein n=1 Tax=Chondromyces crocatus TaxID=52 RepID=A0A0K1E8S9_CHOCO|nr:C1 family peptidase [Chondromyces crocatus]AKT37072.1 uncharacterized protein CMC5_011980 [Chondromyces crocatus]
MNTSTLPLIALALSTLACSSGRATPPRQPPLATSPGGMGAPAAGGTHGTTGAPRGSGAQAFGFSTAGQPAGAQVLPFILRPVNVSALRALQGRRCAPKEVAPDVWVSFECGPAQPITRAVPFVPSNRMGFLSGVLPANVDHRQSGFSGPIKSQQAVGACTAFSLSSAMDHGIRRMGRQETTAPLHVWSKYAVPQMGTAGDRTTGEAITVEPVWPYDPIKACKMMRDPYDDCGAAYNVRPGSGDSDPVLRAEQVKADGQGRYRVIAIEKLQTSPVNLQELSAVLAGGDAVWVSFRVNSDAWKSQSLQNGVLPEYLHDDGSGHAVLLEGYRTVGGAKQFLIHNSWGERWGERGYGWISESNVQRHLRAAYKVRVADPGSPTPQPDASGCPAGQVRDSVLGTCAALCASGSPPAAGVCLPSLPGFSPQGIPGFPGLPAIPGLPGVQPAPQPGPQPSPQPGPQPSPQPSASCPQGQAPDLMSGQCLPLCPSGMPAIGGMCIPPILR